jgi:hypothetical protein
MSNENFNEFANYFYIRHSGEKDYMENYIFSKIIISESQISIFDGQSDDPTIPHYIIILNRLFLFFV